MSGIANTHRQFIVVLRAPTPLVFPHGEGFRLTDVPTSCGPATVSYTSRWINASKSARLPGQLWIEVVGFAPDIKRAVPSLANVGLQALSAISLAGNVAIEHPAIELAFEKDPRANEREFFQAFVRPESNEIAEGRPANRQAIAAVYNRLNASPEKERLYRAANQYRLALDHWRVGAEALALAHCWMAIEALTKAQLRRVHKEKGTSADEELAGALGVPIKELDPTIRKAYLLKGDEECYSKAKKASDGFEHGFLAFHEIHTHAAEVSERLAQHVRSAIFALSDLDQSTSAIVLSEPFDKPLGTWPLIKFIKGKLIGDSADPAPPNQAYPFVTWRSTITSCTFDANGKMNAQFTESFTPQLGEGISLQLSSMQIWRGGSGINLEPQLPTPMPRGNFEITSVTQKGTAQVGGSIVSVDDPVIQQWRQPISALLLNMNAIKHMALFWIYRLGGEQPYRVRRGTFAKHVRRIERLLEQSSISREVREDCRSRWSEALALDNVSEKICRGAPAPEGLICFDDRTNKGAPIIDDPKKAAEISDKAMQLATRLVDLLTKVQEADCGSKKGRRAASLWNWLVGRRS